jgi:hypothetical protein
MRSRHAFALLAALLITLNVLVGTGLISDWGRWYSQNRPYQLQVDALLRGELALGHDPAEVTWDLAWSKGGVHQVWGLGVPLWRLPFEAAARCCGQPMFPDRVAFGAAILVLVYAAILLCWTPGANGGFIELARERPANVLAVPLVALFPPFLTLCRTRFQVYEEASAYSYLMGSALLLATQWFTRAPALWKYAAVGVLAGAAAFVRPTIGFYGCATMIVAWVVTRQIRWPLWKSLTGLIIFAAGCGLFLFTNQLRFGAPLELGHQLNLNSNHAIQFALRFGEPFRNEPLWRASRELIAILFWAGNTFNGIDWYADSFFAGQSPTFRWRELYFKTYDPSYFIAIGAAWTWCAWQSLRRRFAEVSGSQSEARWLAIWSILSAAPLLLLYLRLCMIASRYVFDLAPAMAAGLVAALLALQHKLPSVQPRRTYFVAGIYAIFGLWWGWQVCFAEVAPQFESSGGRTFAEFQSQAEVRELNRRLPETYQFGPSFNGCGIPFNGSGWNAASGNVAAFVAFFVTDPDCLELEVAPVEGKMLSVADYEKIRAKIGLESLELAYSRDIPGGRIVVFHGPRTPQYQSGIQPVFLGFGSPEELSQANSEFRLLRLRWHRRTSTSPETAQGRGQ